MPYLSPDILDAALFELIALANRVDICSREPNTFEQATGTFSLGHATSLRLMAPENYTEDGRQVTVASVPEGKVDASGTVTSWALTDATGRRLLAAGPLASNVRVTTGHIFSLPPFQIAILGAITATTSNLNDRR